MTAFVSGTATDHNDLWTKLITFLTTDATLLAAGEEWSAVWTHASGATSGVVLQGPGLSAGDEVLVGLKLVERPTPDEYEIQILGMTGVLPAATTFDGHVNVTPNKVLMFIDSNPMDYWFVANGRRFMAVVKISTVFEAMYAGLFLPYAPPTSYSYPLFIGGSAGELHADGGATSWRSTDSNHHHFPYANVQIGGTDRNPGAWMLSPQGEWLICFTSGAGGNVAIGPTYFFGGLGITQTSGVSALGYGSIRERLQAGFAGEFPLTPLTLVQDSPDDQTYGVLDGAYHVPGHGNSSENLVTIGGVNHLTVQDVFRTAIGSYWAMALD